MRLSQLVGRTLREVGPEVENATQQLVVRAGVARPLAAGGMILLPLGMRVLRRLEALMHAEMQTIAAQEFRTPVVQPAGIWERSGRYAAYGDAMLRCTTRAAQSMVIAPTHEEAVTEIALREIESYRDLPALLYQIHTKYRDELRARGGLLRLREFTMLDAYSLSATSEQLDAVYDQVAQAFEAIFKRCELAYLKVDADSGQMGGRESREYMALTAAGEDTLVLCRGCDGAANTEIAIAQPPAAWVGTAAQPELVTTPHCRTINELARLLDVPHSATAKAVFWETPERGTVFVVVRGDHEVNEAKLQNLLGVSRLQPASDAAIRATGAVPGYAGPIDVHDITIVADEAVVQAGPLIVGANQEGCHLRNVLYGRDWQAALVADVRTVHAGDLCVQCGAELYTERGVEVGHIFKLGTRYTAAFGANFVDQTGATQPIMMGSYGIGLERLIHMIVDQHHDEHGIIWPLVVAPWILQLVQLGSGTQVQKAAQELYAELQTAGVAVVWDDRPESAGVKFADADLMGMPWRVVISERGLKKQSYELRERATGQTFAIPRAEFQTWLHQQGLTKEQHNVI